MAITIGDGGGTSREAAVDGNLRLTVAAVQSTSAHRANENGDAYNLNTGSITLSDAVDTPIIYFKNNEDRHYNVEAIIIGLGPSTDGTGTVIPITFVRNPTVGTIITSTPTNVAINSNRNYGSNNTLTADVFKGATGDTMTDGEDHIYVFGFQNTRVVVAIDEIIPQGRSIGVKIDPLASNSSMDVYVAIIGHLEDANS